MFATKKVSSKQILLNFTLNLLKSHTYNIVTNKKKINNGNEWKDINKWDLKFIVIFLRNK